MKFPLMLRKTHEAELDKAINIITEKKTNSLFLLHELFMPRHF